MQQAPKQKYLWKKLFNSFQALFIFDSPLQN